MSEIITIKENRDFGRLYRRGKSYVSPVLVTYILKNKNNNLRYGITTGKKIGNAVKRSRSRRIIRAAFRSVSKDLASGYDIIFVARSKTPFVKSTDIEKSMTEHFIKAGLLVENKEWKSFL